MPRVQHIQTNFTAGELSPAVLGRIDLAQYANGAKLMENCFPVIQGGALSRPGTTFKAEIKDSSKRARLVPFVKNRTTAYVLEFGDLYTRSYKNGALVAGSEIVTPYGSSKLASFDYAADADTMYLTHEAVWTQRLRRFSDAKWTIGNAPFTTQPVAEIGAPIAQVITLSDKTVGVGRTATVPLAYFLPADVGRAILSEAGSATITAVGGATSVTVTVDTEFSSTTVPAGAVLDASPLVSCLPSAISPVGASITLTLGADGWRASDDGGFVYINSGVVRIDSISADDVAQGTIISELSALISAPAYAWSVRTSQWSAVDGYPRTVALHQQRLVLASSAKYPQTIWGSRIAEPLDFQLGTDDDLAYSFTVSSDDNNQIQYLSTSRDLLALSFGAEYSLRGGLEKAITPTNVTITPQTDHGCAPVRPVQARREIVFVQGAGKKMRGLSYAYDIDGYNAPDMLALADHLVGRGADGSQLSIVDACYQKEPYGILWAVRSDGLLLSCTLDRSQQVVAWARHDVGGVVESVCTVPEAAADVVHMIVKRTVSGQTRRFIESLHMTTESTHLSEVNGIQTDCAAVSYNAVGSVTWSHPKLFNTRVQVLADGAYMGEFTTDGSGQITLPRVAYSVQIGLGFTSTIKPVTPEIGSQTGTGSGAAMNTSQVQLRVHQSGPMWANDQLLPFANFGGDLLDKPQKLFSGLVEVSNDGWNKGLSEMVLERRLPFPMEVLGVIRTITVNTG